MTTLRWDTRKLVYYSRLDEKAFFTWLESIPGVTGVDGNGFVLMVHLRSKRISQTALRELIAICRRYGGDLGQLAQFLTPQNEDWFKAPGTPWHKAVFR